MRYYYIYDRFTMEHFRLRQRITLTIKIYCSRLYIYVTGNEAYSVTFVLKLIGMLKV
jgi:hypothetical protein